MTNRPTLSDPEEYALIKRIYFEKDDIQDNDRQEIMERRDSKQRNINNNSR